uniref:PDZ domain-containing protein n=2 Tax=Caenorhabditis japonica TaxID=281687 RepID=A0A8R1HYU1_CAEJA
MSANKGKSAEKENTDTENDRTLAEDDENDKNSGALSHRFEKLTVTLERGSAGKKFGLGIVMVHQRILVCKVDPDSLVQGVLKYGDQILEVNKKEVTNKIDCKKRLMAGLKDKGSVPLVILRPKTSDAVTMIEQEIQQSLQQLSAQPSVEHVKKGYVRLFALKGQGQVQSVFTFNSFFCHCADKRQIRLVE